LSPAKKYFSLIKFSHTVFALPFALIGFSLAIHSGQGEFSWRTLILVVLCMVFARSSAMAFNRLIDRTYDAKNERTAIREIPSGVVSPRNAFLLVLICGAGFIITTYYINTICFYLSPVALFIILGYSYTKRFTVLCHLVLGVGLALAPIGAYLAVTGTFAILPLVFSAVVFFWVSGFDIIYSLQDEEFDRSESLKSIPVFLGRNNALKLSGILHVLAAAFVIVGYYYGGFGWLYIAGAAVFIGLLAYQHSIVKPNDLSKVNIAFGTTNGIASVLFCLFVCADIFYSLAASTTSA
jgi:4-hydroxybenzoate polyprenyltransferase